MSGRLKIGAMGFSTSGGGRFGLYAGTAVVAVESLIGVTTEGKDCADSDISLFWSRVSSEDELSDGFTANSSFTGRDPLLGWLTTEAEAGLIGTAAVWWKRWLR